MDATSANVKNEIIAGRNAVLEAIRAGREIDTIYITETDPRAAGKIRAMARNAGIVVKTASRQKLDEMAEGVNHQGAVAVCACASYATVEEILEEAQRKGTPPLIVIADEIEDPHNLGAIIRTAEACGADGVILPKRRSASLNATVYKTSAGAASVLKVARVSNLTACMKQLKKQGIWMVGADMDGQSWNQVDLTLPIGLVIGSEGNGISRLVREECDFIASLPMKGQINSLNASVAAGILLYEAVRQRLEGLR